MSVRSLITDALLWNQGTGALIAGLGTMAEGTRRVVVGAIRYDKKLKAMVAEEAAEEAARYAPTVANSAIRAGMNIPSTTRLLPTTKAGAGAGFQVPRIVPQTPFSSSNSGLGKLVQDLMAQDSHASKTINGRIFGSQNTALIPTASRPSGAITATLPTMANPPMASSTAGATRSIMTPPTPPTIKSGTSSNRTKMALVGASGLALAMAAGGRDN